MDFWILPGQVGCSGCGKLTNSKAGIVLFMNLSLLVAMAIFCEKKRKGLMVSVEPIQMTEKITDTE